LGESREHDERRLGRIRVTARALVASGHYISLWGRSLGGERIRSPMGDGCLDGGSGWRRGRSRASEQSGRVSRAARAPPADPRGVPGVAGARLEERAREYRGRVRRLRQDSSRLGLGRRLPSEIHGPHLDALSGMSDPAIFNRGRLLHHAMAPGPREQLGERNEQ
jgi:hypothetical protein